MLQQTQVGTVIDYYLRFTQRFPDIRALGEANQDDVLHLWSGLGYYARGRNLHRAAQMVCEQHDGKLPEDIDTLQTLPGVGRSTAGAILSLARGQRHPILDGNVKRVLCRYHAVEGWPGQSAVNRKLWALAETHTPDERVAAYTQAIMDLGATLCTRTRPQCDPCPVRAGCVARHKSRQAELPARKPKKDLPRRATIFVILRDEQGRFLLEKRPPIGIWGGLWGFPECDVGTNLEAWVEQRLGRTVGSVTRLAVVHHGFTHYHLDIHPVLIQIDSNTGRAHRVSESRQTLWHDGSTDVGLAAPVSKLLASLEHHTQFALSLT